MLTCTRRSRTFKVSPDYQAPNYHSARILMLEQEVVSERDLRGKSDRVKSDVQRDLEDTLEQLRIANLNNDSKGKDLKVNTQ